MTEITHIGDLIPDPDNARSHTARGVGMIEEALNGVGAARSIVIDENGTVLAGNATIEAAAAAGIEDVRVVPANGNTIIAVQRSDLTDDQKKRLALYDNRAGEESDWDAEVLAKLKEQDEELLKGLFRDDELEEILGDISHVQFQEYDESIADEVEYIECPKCGHKWPK